MEINTKKNVYIEHFYFVTTHTVDIFPLRILKNILYNLISWNEELLKIYVRDFTCMSLNGKQGTLDTDIVSMAATSQGKQ